MRHMEIPRLGVKTELSLLAYTTAIAMPDPSPVCELHLSSQQRWILNPLNEARERTCVLTDATQIHFHSVTTETPLTRYFKKLG